MRTAAARNVAALLVVLTTACASSDSGEATQPAAGMVSPTASPTDEVDGEFHAGVVLGEHAFDLYVPPAGAAAEPMPVVIALHGRPGSSVESQAQFQPLAAEHGFLVAYPRIQRQRWQLEIDSPDIDYMRQLISELIGTWDADPERIYVTGMSAGGDMAISVGLQLSDVVTAVAPVAPPAGAAVSEVGDQLAAPVAIAAFIGAADTRFADAGLELLATWRDGAGCDDEEEHTETADLTTTVWQCDDGTDMVLHVLADQGHVWFGEPDAREPLWASEAMWEFFAARTGGSDR